MIKIASIVPYRILPPVQGGERHTYFFLEALSRYAELTCITVWENASWSSERISIKPFLGSTENKFRYTRLRLYSKIKNLCQQQGISTVVLEHPYYGWLGYLLKRRAGLQLVIHSHNIESNRFKTLGKRWWKLLFWYEKFVHRQADLSFFITQEDQDFAIDKYGLDPKKCCVSTYGIDATDPPVAERALARHQILKELALDASTTLFLFNGALNYLPNQHAVEKIIRVINPLLRKRTDRTYKIIICGKASESLQQEMTRPENAEIIYAGFVPDIQQYFLAADIFLNPVTEGGGIKTKLVEALAANTPAVSFKTGAYGIPLSVTGGRLSVVADDNFEAFTDAVQKLLSAPQRNVPAAFFEHFNWNAIAKRAASQLEQLS